MKEQGPPSFLSCHAHRRTGERDECTTARYAPKREARPQRPVMAVLDGDTPPGRSAGRIFRLDLSSGIGGFRETLHRVPKKRKLHRVEHGFCPPPPSGRSGSCLSTLTGASEIQWWSGSCASDPPPSKNGQWMSLFGVITTKP